MKKYLLIGIAIVVAVFFAVYNYAFDSKLDLNGDNAQYIMLARNIADGFGYSQVSLGVISPASHFPPGYPSILSIFMLLGIQSLAFFKVLNGIFLLVSLLLLGYVVYKLTQNQILGFVVAFIPIFSPHLQHFSNIVMSEMSYLFFTVLSFFALYKYDKIGEKRFWKSAWFYVAIIAAVAAYYIRTVGASCIFALLVFFLFRKEWKATLASAAGVVLLFLPWSIRNYVYGIESRYFGTIMTVNPWRPEEGTISSVEEMWTKMLKNFDETVIKGFKEGLFPFLQIDYGTDSSFVAIVVGLLLLSVVFYGAWRIKPLRWYLLAFLLANIGLFMLWHGGNGIRYVVPVLPVIFLCFYVGIYALLELLAKYISKQKAWLKYIPFVFLLIILKMVTPLKMQAEMAKMPYPSAYKNYFSVAEKVNGKNFRGSVVCCRKPDLFAFYAPNVYATNYKYTQNTYELIVDLVKKNVDYVVLEQLGFSSTARYLYPAIVDHAELFSVVYQRRNPDTFLLEFDKKKATEKIKENGWKYIK